MRLLGKEISLASTLNEYVEKSNDLVNSMYHLTHAEWIFVHFMIACVDRMHELELYLFEFTDREIVSIVNFDGVRRLESTKRVMPFLEKLLTTPVYFPFMGNECVTGWISGIMSTSYGTRIF